MVVWDPTKEAERRKQKRDAPARGGSGRIPVIDVARGIAFVAMAVFHFHWDLEFFGFLEPGASAEPEWKYFARAIASSFLFLVGVGLVLAHNKQFRSQTYIKRLAMVAIAAALISVATYYFTPDAFIFFGILHSIAFAYLAGLVFLRLPWWVNIAAAMAVFSLGMLFTHAAFQSPALIWLGMSPVPPYSNDFVPVFPWFSAVLMGMAFTQLGLKLGWDTWLRTFECEKPVDRMLAFFGRHSLIAYLLHQPIMIGLIYAFMKVKGLA